MVRTADEISNLIEKLHKDVDSEIRIEAAQELGLSHKSWDIESQRAIIPLIEILNDEDYEIREVAAWALGYLSRRFESNKAIEPLKNVLEEDEDSHVRFAALSALWKIQPEDIHQLIIEAAQDQAENVRKLALTKFRRLK